MPLVKNELPPDRVEFSKSLSEREIDGLVRDPAIRVLQCSSPVETETWDLLNQSLFTRRPEIQLRVYGFFSSVCDLSFLPCVRRVRHFSADSIMRAVGTEHLCALENLESLAVGIYDLDSFDFLAGIPGQIKKLSLHATKSKKPGLALLKRFNALTSLYLEGQQKDIDVFSELGTLEELTLRSISLPGLDFLASLNHLRSLEIKLGGITDLSAIEGKDSIKYIELWQVKGLSDLSVVSTLYGLQFLFLQSLRHVREIPDLSKLVKLRRVWLDNMKGLKDVSALQYAPCLEDFVHISAQNMQPEQYETLLGVPTLKRVSVGFGSVRKSRSFEHLRHKAGVSEFGCHQFIFA